MSSISFSQNSKYLLTSSALPTRYNMPPESTKRPANSPTPVKLKKARISVPESETEQAKSIEQYRIPMKNAAVYYLPDFIDDSALADELYQQLLEIDGCEHLHFILIPGYSRRLARCD